MLLGIASSESAVVLGGIGVLGQGLSFGGGLRKIG